MGVPRPQVLPSELLQTHWHPGRSLQNPPGHPPWPLAYDLLDGWHAAIEPFPWTDWLAALAALQEAVGEISNPFRSPVLWAWNDGQRRTKAEVIAVSEEAERRLGWGPAAPNGG